MEWLRRGTKLGPVMLVAELAAFGVVMAAATVHRVLVRRGISRIADLDVTGQRMRVLPQRFEYRVHLNVKKIGKIPDGGGTGSTTGAPTPIEPPSAVVGPGMPTCTRRSTTARGWPTPKSWPTRRVSPPPGSGTGPRSSSPPTASTTSTAR